MSAAHEGSAVHFKRVAGSGDWRGTGGGDGRNWIENADWRRAGNRWRCHADGRYGDCVRGRDDRRRGVNAGARNFADGAVAAGNAIDLPSDLGVRQIADGCGKGDCASQPDLTGAGDGDGGLRLCGGIQAARTAAGD